MKISRTGDIIILEPDGPVAEYRTEWQQELLAVIYEVSLFDNGRELRAIADLSKVTFMNSTGLGQFIHAHTTFKTRRGRFALCAVPERVAKLLHLTNLDRVFEVFPTREAALLAFNGPLTEGTS